MKSKTILILILLSIVFLIIGLYPVVIAKISDPIMGYYIWPVTFPAWFLSALFGIILGIRCKTETLYAYKVSKFGWLMLSLNIAAFIYLWFISGI